MWFLPLFLCLELATSTVPTYLGTYLWGPPADDVASLAMNETILGPHIDSQYSIIQVRVSGKKLWIDLVRKSKTTWPLEIPFCSLMLPSVIQDFLDRLGVLELTEIMVINASSTPYIACRCYARTFVSFGFTSINKEMVENEDGLTEFCKTTKLGEMHGRTPTLKIPKLKYSSKLLGVAMVDIQLDDPAAILV